MSDQNVCGIDIETTGLDPAKGLPLEVGCIILNENYEEKARFGVVVRATLPILQATMSRDVAIMHAKSGLLKEVGGPNARDLAEADALLAHFIVSNGGEDSPLFGSSVHFDRKWMERYFPLSLSKLHYRNIDVSVLLEMARRKKWGIQKTPPELIPHRAMPDLESSIGMMKFFEKHFVQAPPDEYKEPFYLGPGGAVLRPGDLPKPEPKKEGETTSETKVEPVKPSGETKVTVIGEDVSRASAGGGATRVTPVLTSEPVKMRSVDFTPQVEAPGSNFTPPSEPVGPEHAVDEPMLDTVEPSQTGDGGV